MSEKVSSLYIALLIGAVVVVGLSSIQVDVYSNYGITSSDLTYLNATGEIINQTSDLKDSIENTVITGFQPLDQFIASTYQTTKILFGIIDIYDNFITDTATMLGIPTGLASLVVSVIVVIITLLVIFALIRIVTHESV